MRIRAMPPYSAARDGAVSVDLSTFSGALGGCGQTVLGPLRAGGCARAEVGVLRARAVGARTDGAATPFALRAEIGAVVPFSRARFQIAGLGTLYSTASVAPELVIGFDVAL